MIQTDRHAAAGRMPSRDPFSTCDAVQGWVQHIAPWGLFTTDVNLVIRSWNRWLETHSDLLAGAVVGRPLVEVFPDLRARKLDAYFTAALRGEISVLSTALHRYLLPLPPVARDSPVLHMLQTARVAPLPAGEEIVGTITIIEDVTQRECQALRLRRQHTHDRLLSDALALLLRSERPLDIAADLFARLTAPLKLEVFFHHLVSPDGSELRLHAAGGITPAMRETMATFPMGEGFTGQLALQRVPQLEQHVRSAPGERAQALRRLGLRSYAGFPLLIGDRLLGTLAFGSCKRDVIAPDEVKFLAEVAHYVAAALDRAGRENALREAQQGLRQHAAELETKIAERTVKLRDSIEQLERFSSTVAHDLRGPIRSIMGFTEILVTDFESAVPPEALKLLQRLNRASHRLDALTRDLLTFSRIVGQDVTLAPVDLDELVADIRSATPALQPGVLTVQSSLGVVWAQRTMLQQCLSNLFDNALKFMPPGVVAHINVCSERHGAAAPLPLGAGAPFPPPASAGPSAAGPRQRIWIEDNGIGIPRVAHEKIFGIFERLPGATHVEGTGIGLAIVARATAQMRGTCGVESVPGAGSRFWLEFAVAPKPNVAAATKGNEEAVFTADYADGADKGSDC